MTATLSRAIDDYMNAIAPEVRELGGLTVRHLAGLKYAIERALDKTDDTEVK